MKKLLAAATVAAVLLPSASFAETLQFPSEKPIAEITIPDSWEPEETETGIQATSPDSAIYLSIDVANEKTTDKVIDDAVAFLEENGVKIDASTQKQSEDKVNGMEMSNFDWDGKDADGDANIGLSLVSPQPGKLLIITYWGTKGEQEKHAEALVKLIGSLKPTRH
jgi:opacity protein-like surface antigen